ncbi:MAG: flagellar basal body rod protein FlgB [Gammaproteobacteria bacterium]|jgi:flagellar basal-body rod protein FlgB|nr:flagellar basal body rod protein FlgB [Gammaproteobacteria bacterium]
MNVNDMFGIHEQVLQLRGKRTEVLASNLANADTPGYQARDMDFKDILSEVDSQHTTGMVATNPRHISSAQEMMEPTLKYRVPLQSKLDGNTVDTQVETSKFAENTMKYMASLRFIDANIKNMLVAIRGE